PGLRRLGCKEYAWSRKLYLSMDEDGVGTLLELTLPVVDPDSDYFIGDGVGKDDIQIPIIIQVKQREAEFGMPGPEMKSLPFLPRQVEFQTEVVSLSC